MVRIIKVPLTPKANYLFVTNYNISIVSTYCHMAFVLDNMISQLCVFMECGIIVPIMFLLRSYSRILTSLTLFAR